LKARGRVVKGLGLGLGEGLLRAMVRSWKWRVA